mmetsp:Transcript_13612/g.21451  ORF Transcript_13612/g.21451 Transcript_13612/m.21451 type:complete len:90 (+) Transcript_13612:190-459(+)
MIRHTFHLPMQSSMAIGCPFYKKFSYFSTTETSTNNNDDLLNYIGCPISKTVLHPLSPTELKSDLQIVFPIKDGIPILNPLKGIIIKEK